MIFAKMSVEMRDLLEKYLDRNPLYDDYFGSELNFQNLAIWKDADDIETGEEPGKYLLVRAFNQGIQCYMPPVAKTWGDFLAGLRWMESDCARRNVPFVVKGLTGSMADHLRSLSDGYLVTEDRDLFEYLYDSKDLTTLEGKKFHNKRNLVHQFLRQNPWVFRSYEPADFPKVLELLSRWEEEKLHAFEHKAILKTLECLDCYGCFADVLLSGDRLVAFSIGTKTPKMGLVFFEKADTEFTGSYAAVNLLFAQKHFGDVPLVNRQEDLGIAELRRAKLSYNPVGFAQKFTLTRNRLTDRDLAGLQSLYREAFEDSEGFLAFFFREKFRPENVVFLRENDQIVSALHFIPKKIAVREAEFAFPFVVAAATRKEWRGKGLMHGLLRKAFFELNNRGIVLCGLSPFSESFYAESGFVTIRRSEETEILVVSPDPFRYETVSPEAMESVRSLYEEKSRGAEVRIVRDEKAWALFHREVAADGGSIILVMEGEKPVGYFTEFPSGVEEVCFPDESKMDFVSRFRGKKIPRFGIETGEGHTMVRILDIKKFLSEYPYEPGLSATRRIRLTDASFPPGNQTLELTVREGKGYVRDIEEFDGEMTLEELTREIFLEGSVFFPKPDILVFDKY